MHRIFILEDDESLRTQLQRLIENQGHSVVAASSIAQADAILDSDSSFDLMILDWDLPDGSGVDLCRKVRARGHTASILLLTGKSLVSQKEEALDGGADDYLTKPFHLKELTTRVSVLIRRSSRPIQSDELVSKELRVDRRSMTCTVAGTPVDLTSKEFSILEFLMRHQNKVISAEQLLNHLWTADENAAPDTVRTHIRNLRKKLQVTSPTGADYIDTVHAIGYRFTD